MLAIKLSFICILETNQLHVYERTSDVAMQSHRQFVIKQTCKKKKKKRERQRLSLNIAFVVVISTELSITHYSRSGQKTGKLSLSTQQRMGSWLTSGKVKGGERSWLGPAFHIPCPRHDGARLLDLCARFPWLVYLASYSNTKYVQISWLILKNVNSCQIGNMHSGKDIVVKLSWLR